MITGIRFIAFCDRVETEPTTNLIGLWDAALLAGNRPGAVSASLVLQLEIDATRTAGHVQIEAPDFDESFPFDIRTDRPLTAILLPLLIPAVREGMVKVSVIDDATRKRPWTYGWAIGFEPGAPPLDESPAEIVAAAKSAAQTLRKGLMGDGAMKMQ